MHKFSIYLRGFKEEDVPFINQLRHNLDVQQYTSTSFKYVSESIEKEWVKQKMMDNRKDIYLAICLVENDQMIGYASINDIDYINRCANRSGIIIHPEFQIGIYRYEAGILMRQLAFDHLNLNRYCAKCLVEHKVSLISMLANGFKIEGKLRQAIYKNGRYHDQFQLALIREDYYTLLNNEEYTLKNHIKRIKFFKKQINENCKSIE